MYGSLHFEQLRRVKAEADRRELQNAILRAEFLPWSELERVFSGIASGMKEIVRSSKVKTPE
jgi:hypothetical protein